VEIAYFLPLGPFVRKAQCRISDEFSPLAAAAINKTSISSFLEKGRLFQNLTKLVGKVHPGFKIPV